MEIHHFGLYIPVCVSYTYKALDEQAVRLAVTAHIRHTETNYDDLLLRGFERREARSTVQADVKLTVDAWKHGSS